MVALRARVAELEAQVMALESQLAEMTPGKRPGPRARAGETSERRALRVRDDERAAWQRAAGATDLGAWARMVWDLAARGPAPARFPAAPERTGPARPWTYRATDEELACWGHAADDAFLSLATWQRQTLNAAAAAG